MTSKNRIGIPGGGERMTSARDRIVEDVVELMEVHGLTGEQGDAVLLLAMKAARLGAQHADMDRPYAVVETISREGISQIIAGLREDIDAGGKDE